jgi:hypothetical protein
MLPRRRASACVRCNAFCRRIGLRRTGCARSSCRSPGACHRPVGRREEPNSGARPNQPGFADEEGPRGNHEAPRHHDAVRHPPASASLRPHILPP